MNAPNEIYLFRSTNCRCFLVYSVVRTVLQRHMLLYEFNSDKQEESLVSASQLSKGRLR